MLGVAMLGVAMLGAAVSDVAMLGIAMLGIAMLGIAVLGIAVLGAAVLGTAMLLETMGGASSFQASSRVQYFMLFMSNDSGVQNRETGEILHSRTIHNHAQATFMSDSGSTARVVCLSHV